MKKPKPSCNISIDYAIPKQLKEKLEMGPYILNMLLINFCTPSAHINAIPLIALGQINISHTYLDIIQHMYDLSVLNDDDFQLSIPVKKYLVEAHMYCSHKGFKNRFLKQTEEKLAKNESYLLKQKLNASKKRTQQEADLLAVDYAHQSVKQFRKEVFSDHTNNRGRSSFSSHVNNSGSQSSSSSHVNNSGSQSSSSSHVDNSGSQSSSPSHVDNSPSQSSSPSHIDNDDAIQDENSVPVNTRKPDTTIRLTKISKTYTFKSPVSCLTMPHTPKIQERDSRAILKNCALGIESLINKSEYTDTDEMKEPKINQKHQRDNMSLSKICGIMDFLRDALNYEFYKLVAALWTHPILDSSDSTARHFASIIAYTLTDFHCNSKQTNLLEFSWCEKLVETQRYAQIEEVNFVLADVERNGIIQENVNHTLEDTLKLICECNGALFYILSQFNKCSFETALRRSTFGVQVIKNTLTLSKMNLKNESQWKFVELRSAIVPTKWDDRFEWVAMFELMASFYLELIEQEQVIMDIKKEVSGLGYVAAEDTFSARLNMH